MHIHKTIDILKNIYVLGKKCKYDVRNQFNILHVFKDIFQKFANNTT